MECIQESAYAKINLFLDIVGKRPDGYHLIDGVMQSISLCDEISIGFQEGNSISKKDSQIILQIMNNSGLPEDDKNLAVRAAKAFLAKTGKNGTVQILLKKKIPMAAGLAGGSADAAAVLRALNRLTGNPLSEHDLLQLAVTLGADVPFCLHTGAKRTRGIGEILDDFPTMPDCFLVVACGKDGVSTQWAYQKLDERYESFKNSHFVPSSVEKMLDGLQKNDIFLTCQSFFNIFQQEIAEVLPEVDRIRERMLGAGAIAAMMSGSGPSVFGVFSSETQAKAITELLLTDGLVAFCCHPVA